MKKKEWQKFYELSDAEMDRLDYILKLFAGRIVSIRGMTVGECIEMETRGK